MIKRWLLIVLAAALLSVAGCGGGCGGAASKDINKTKDRPRADTVQNTQP